MVQGVTVKHSTLFFCLGGLAQSAGVRRFTLTLRGASSVLRIKRVVCKPAALAPFLSPSSLAQSPEFPRVIDTLRKGLPSATRLNILREEKQRCSFLVPTCSSFADYEKAFFFPCSVGAP